MSSPSGDVRGAEEAIAIAVALLPPDARVERVPCSSPGHAPDLVARLAGTGRPRLLLVGHVDTVVAHGAHEPLRRDGDRLVGSGTVDMKGGRRPRARRPASARGAACRLRGGRAAARRRRGVAHGALRPRRALRGLRRLPVLRGRARPTPTATTRSSPERKAAGTVRITAAGRSRTRARRPTTARTRCSRSPPPRRPIAAQHDPARPRPPDRRPDRGARRATRSTSSPAAGELICDVRADAPRRLRAACSPRSRRRSGGATLTAENLRRWPGMDSRDGARAACSRVPGRRSAARSRPAGAAARATPATSPRRSR